MRDVCHAAIASRSLGVRWKKSQAKEAPVALEETEDFLGDRTRGVKENLEPEIAVSSQAWIAWKIGRHWLAKKRAVAGSDDLPNFKHTEWGGGSARNPVGSVQL